MQEDIGKIIKEFKRCREDAFYFATHYVYTFDQSKGAKTLYPQWGYLEEILKKIDQPGDFYLEKSRDMVISWTVMVYFLHAMIFKENWAGFAISRKEAEVDDGGSNSTPESLFGRLRYIWKNLPEWMRPHFTFTHLKVINQDTGSYCTGESANPDSGRNVACTFKFADEFCFLPINDQESINNAMRFGSYRTLLYVTTAKKGTLGEKISREGMKFEKIQVPWHLRPDKDKAWYDKKVAGSDAGSIAAELDISYSPNVEEKIVGQYWNETEQIVDSSDMPSILEYQQIVCGMDYGYLRTAVELCGFYKDIWWVFVELYEFQKTPEEMVEDIDKLRSLLKIDFPVYCGKDRPDLLRCLSMKGFVSMGFNEPVGVRIGALVNLFRRKRIKVISTARGLLSEIPRYRRQRIGGILVDTPEKHDVDEAMDALGYFLLGIGEVAQSGEWISDWAEEVGIRGGDWVSSEWDDVSEFINLQWAHEKYLEGR